jgi:ribosomal protein S12 methylthiotransferase accessory factor
MLQHAPEMTEGSWRARVPASGCVDSPPAVYYRGRALRAAKRFLDGTHRTVPPAETLARVRPHFQAVGITRVADITGLDRIGIPTTLAQRPNSPTLSNSSGKGFTLTAALVSGAMEGIELYHAEHVDVPVRYCSHAELEEGGETVPADRLSIAKQAFFSSRRTEPWVQGWDIAVQRPVWVPFAQVAMGPHNDSRFRRLTPFAISSNGLASGNVLIEAICAGLLEAIERDAVACHLIARNRLRRGYPKVDTATIRSPLVQDLLRRLEMAEIGVVLYDLSVDTDVPVYMATIYDRLYRHLGMCAGYGAHLAPEIAMIRALTEAVQSRVIFIAGSRDDYFRHDYLKHRLFDDEREVQHIESQPATVDASARVSEATPTFEGDLGVLLEKLRRAELRQVVVVDLTHPELDIPVARVIVPGLEACAFLDNYSPSGRAAEFVRCCSQGRRA